MNRPIGEFDLHAYIDRQLDAARRAEVEGYLAAHPEAAAYVQHLRDQIRALHCSYDGILNEPVPARFTDVVGARRRSNSLAAGIAWLACGLTVGWFAHGLIPERTAPGNFARNALTAHALYVVENRHPVEVPADQEAHLAA
ncbi:MAG TPA: hypothetical protein VHK70_08600 [Burkholderiaceae bacterium]|nr:hypothetical protein [Burkholderiaceae bacterium]